MVSLLIFWRRTIFRVQTQTRPRLLPLPQLKRSRIHRQRYLHATRFTRKTVGPKLAITSGSSAASNPAKYTVDTSVANFTSHTAHESNAP